MYSISVCGIIISAVLCCTTATQQFPACSAPSPASHKTSTNSSVLPHLTVWHLYHPRLFVYFFSRNPCRRLAVLARRHKILRSCSSSSSNSCGRTDVYTDRQTQRNRQTDRLTCRQAERRQWFSIVQWLTYHAHAHTHTWPLFLSLSLSLSLTSVPSVVCDVCDVLMIRTHSLDWTQLCTACLRTSTTSDCSDTPPISTPCMYSYCSRFHLPILWDAGASGAYMN